MRDDTQEVPGAAILYEPVRLFAAYVGVEH